MRLALALFLLVTAPARASEDAAVHTDGLGFPIYPHAATYAVFGTNIAYVAASDVDTIAAWYRSRSGRPWVTAGTDERGPAPSATMSFTDVLGVHRLHIAGTRGRSAIISEALALSPAAAAASDAEASVLHGPTDPLGAPLYPRRIAGKSVVVMRDSHGLVSYASTDSFDTVFGWFNARLSNRYALSYHLDRAGTKMRTFDGGRLSISVTRRAGDRELTVVGVQWTE